MTSLRETRMLVGILGLLFGMYSMMLGASMQNPIIFIIGLVCMFPFFWAAGKI